MIVAGVDQTPRARRLLERGRHSGRPDDGARRRADRHQYRPLAAGAPATPRRRYLLDSAIAASATSRAPLDPRSQRRIDGYVQAMQEAGIDMPDASPRRRAPVERVARRRAFRASMLDAAPDIEAVFCCNDDLALGASSNASAAAFACPTTSRSSASTTSNSAPAPIRRCPRWRRRATRWRGRAAEIVLEIIRGSGERPRDRRIDIGFRIVERASTAPSRRLRRVGRMPAEAVASGRDRPAP